MPNTPAEAVDIPEVEERPAKVEETPLEAIASMASVLVIGLFFLTFLAQNFVIPSSSMEKTLLIGDHVAVDRITLAPATSWMPLVHYRPVQRGDILVFIKPNEPNLTLVKRVVGIPGDRIHLRDGIVYLNGVAQNEPHAQQPSDNNYYPYRDDFPAIRPSLDSDVTAQWAVDLPNHVDGMDLVVPADRYFMMGDNRTVSLDSRYWGFVPKENILGRPLVIYWSYGATGDQYLKTGLLDRVGSILSTAAHFPTRTRWSRTFRLVR